VATGQDAQVAPRTENLSTLGKPEHLGVFDGANGVFPAPLAADPAQDAQVIQLEHLGDGEAVVSPFLE
jgi:hypothetical protein